MNSFISISTALLLSLTSIIRPDIGIRWILIAAVIVVGSIGYFLPQYNYISYGVGFSGISLLLIAATHFLSKSHKSLDSISISFIAFIFFLIIPTISNANNPLQVIAFGKNIIQYWGFVPLAALGFMPVNSRSKIIRLIIIFIVIQAVVSIYQAAFIVDWANRIAGGDSVVGTFGGTPDGGGSSGAQTIFLTVIISIALTTYISKHIKLFHLLIVLAMSLIPISLNETKVFFVLMPIVLIYILLSGFKSHPTRTLQVTLIGISLVVTIFTIYFLFLQHSYTGNDSKSISEYTDRMAGSTSGFYIGKGQDASKSRLGSIKFWFEEQTNKGNYLQLLVGYGLGASKYGGIFPGNLTSKNGPYYGLKLDRTGLSSLLWDIGILGTFIFFIIFITAWTLVRKTRRLLSDDDYNRSILWGVECGIIILALTNIYDSYFFTNPGLNAFTMILFAFAVSTLSSKRISNAKIRTF